MIQSDVRNIAVIGNYMPRLCGIATFTTDLVTALRSTSPTLNAWAMAMNDTVKGYRYPDEVRFEINQNLIHEYELAADFLNINQIDVVCLQHEYGIYGGKFGGYILRLLSHLRMPVASVFHTVLKDPLPEQKKMLAEIAEQSERVIVMAQRAREFMIDIYNVPEKKIVHIPHGIPDMPFVDPNYHKDQFGVEGRRVILTFGLLSPNKGIEYMISALPAIVKKYPDAVYIVLGATHPHVKQHNGEQYRNSLKQLAKNIGVDANVIFHNRFVEITELCEFLGASDIYVTPYLNEAQIVSGTLAYALGVGKATVSTPYWYAEEMLSNKRGCLVPFKDPDAMAEAIINLFDNEVARHAMRKNAYTFCRTAVWREVAQQYLDVFREVKEERRNKPHMPFIQRTLNTEKTSLPEIKLNQLRTLTDSTGIIQHGVFSIPNRFHGYCTDDNARALIVALTAQPFLPQDTTLHKLHTRYLSFLHHAFNEENGRFRNFMDYSRNWRETEGSEDSHGRAIWSLGVNAAQTDDPGALALGTTILKNALPATENFVHPRAMAFALVGIHAYLRRFSGDSDVRRYRELLAQRIFDMIKAYSTRHWPWHEQKLSYANAKVPQALLLSGLWMENDAMINQGFTTLDWLIELQMKDGHFSPVGNNGWYEKDGDRARFDQQPIEAHAMVDACLEAYKISKDEKYAETAYTAFNWFLGQNDLRVPLYDYKTGGCYDGLQPNGANYNQGAESTLAWLMSLVAMYVHTIGEEVPSPDDQPVA